MPVLFYLLLIVVAFDLAIQPWANRSPLFLLSVPVVLAFVALCVGLFVKATIIDQARHLYRELAKEKEQRADDKPCYLSFNEQLSCLISKPARLAMLFAGVYLGGCLVLLLGWNDFTMDFAVVAVLLWTSARLFRPGVWSEDATLQERRRLYAVVAVAVVGFALEGSVLPDATTMMDGVVGSIVPAAVPVPQGFAALLVTVAILLQSHTLIPTPSGAGEVAAQRRIDALFPAVPLLILVLCAETAILPYVGPVWVAAVIPLVAMAGLASLHLLLRRSPRRLTMPRRLKAMARYPSVHRFISYPGVTSLVVLYLVACPLLVWTLAELGENPPSTGTADPANARSVLLLTFVINLFYLSVVVGIAVFRLQEVARWAFGEAWTGLRERIGNLGRGLSILVLVVFSPLALLSAETWETMRTISTKDYLLLVGSILGLAGAFHLVTSVQHVTTAAEFDTWAEVRAAAMPELGSSRNGDSTPDPEVKELLDSKELRLYTLTNTAPKHPLGGLETINSVIVTMTYEIFFFFPVAIIAAVIFLTFGRVTVPDTVAANWIYGDRASPDELKELIGLRFFQQPWVRVGLLLTAFAILTLLVGILAEPGRRGGYFHSADTAVRQRLAVRLAYCEVRARRGLPLPRDPGPPRRDRRARHRSTPQSPASSHR
jgi:hypothetical protein